MSQDYRSLEAAMLGLVESLGEKLSGAETQEVRAFIDAGEYGVAFETLCSIIRDEQKPVSAAEARSIGSLARWMEIDEEYWREIVDRNAGGTIASD